MFRERKETSKLKRIIEVAFLAVASIVLIAQLVTIYLRWRHGKDVDREIREGARAVVVKVVSEFPPAFLIEYANSGRLPIGKTRFQMSIELDAVEIARTERDYGEIKPGKTERLLLQTVASASPPPKFEPGTRVTYRLLVFPNDKKPLPELTGQVALQ